MALVKVITTNEVDDTPVNGVTTEPVSSNWAYDHSVDFDAHHVNEFEVMREGDNCINPSVSSGIATQAIAANRLYGLVFYTPITRTFDRIVFEITGAGAGGTKIRVGIYNDGTNGYPGTLVTEAAGEIDATDVSTHSVAIDEELTRGHYFLALVSDGVPTIRACGQYSKGTYLGELITDITSPQLGWYAAHAYGALPDPFTGGGTGLRINALLLLLRPKA